MVAGPHPIQTDTSRRACLICSSEARAAICGEPYEGYLLIGKFELLRLPHLQVSVLYDIPGMEAAAQLRYGGLDLIADLALGPSNPAVRGWAEQNDYQVMTIAPRPA